MHIARVREIIERARSKRILVAGDLMLDEFLWGDVTRISPEAPVPVVRVTGESWYPGGAANVARNVHEFCGWTGVLGVTGADVAGVRLAESLKAQGVDTSGCIQHSDLFTTVKTRIIAKHQQVVRVDRERDMPLPAHLSRMLHDAARRLIPSLDGIIFSDYAKGLLTQPLVDTIRELAGPQGKIITVDPSPINPLDWSGTAAIKPNRSEALRAAGFHEPATGVTEDVLRMVGEKLIGQWNTRMILLTLGEEGMLLLERGQPVFHTPARAREVYDVSGAGDTAIAVFTAALCAGAKPAEAAELANAASGIVVGKLGTATASPAELIADYEAVR